MEIITYNIWDLPLWFLRGRDKRLLEIVHFLSARQTDIVCLQESWNLTHRRLISEHMRKEGYYDAVKLANIRRNNGGLLTFSKFPIRSIRFIPFGRRGMSVSEFIGNKGVLETILDTPMGLLRVLNIHLHHESSKRFDTARIRIRQLRKLFSVIAAEPAMPTVLAGDFNQHDMMYVPSFQKMFSKKGYAHSEDGSGILPPSYRKENPLVNNWINRIAASKRYDYILLKDMPMETIKIEEYGPLYLHPALSDHDPVVLRFEITHSLQ